MTQVEQQRILSILEKIYRDTYSPAKSVALAQHCFMSERNARYKLVKLEKAGLVQRVGVRGGWLPVAA